MPFTLCQLASFHHSCRSCTWFAQIWQKITFRNIPFSSMNHNDSRSWAIKPWLIYWHHKYGFIQYCIKSKSLTREVKRCTTDGKQAVDISTWMFLASLEWTSTTLETFPRIRAQFVFSDPLNSYIYWLDFRAFHQFTLTFMHLSRSFGS